MDLMSPRTIATLRHAERFVTAELEVRRSSYGKNPEPDEREDIADAETLLRAVRRAINRETKRK